MENPTQTAPPRVETLATYYMLPLLRLTKGSFGPKNFLNCFVDKHNRLIVECKDRQYVDPGCLQHPGYITDFQHPDSQTTYFLYKAEQFLPDVQKFREGKYSHFSSEAKTRIRQFAMNYTPGGMLAPLAKDNTLLLALDRDPRLRKQRETEFDTHIGEDWELMPLPKSINFIEL